MSDTAQRIATSVKMLETRFDPEAAEILSRCPASGSQAAAEAALANARGEEGTQVLGVFVEGDLAGAYILRRVTMSNEISLLAIAPAFERQGLGKMCLYDALFRSGKRPLVVEADESNVAFFKRCGFKMVGKRKQPDGTFRYRLGWHAPIPKADGTGEVVC
jgi:GNAT superfamily N-acetyltransferase